MIHSLMGRLALVTSSLVLLAGCSDKPSQGDVAKALAAVYECPILEVRDVKKLDGEPGPQGSYDVALSYTVAIKGGDGAGAKLLTEWVHLRAEREAVAAALRVLHQAPQGDARVKALGAYDDQLTSALSALLPCGGPEMSAVVMPLYEKAREALKAGAGTAALPVGAQLSRPGRMRRSEQGWYFTQLAAGFSGFELVTTRPMALAMPASKVPGLVNVAAPAAAEGERTLVGTIRRGATDSCIAVMQGGVEKCYGLPGEPEQAQRIYGLCGDGDTCAITGTWDDNAESLGAFGKVEKVTR